MFDHESIADQDIDQSDESEAELYFSIVDAIRTARNIGLPDEQVKTLCYAVGIDYEVIE